MRYVLFQFLLLLLFSSVIMHVNGEIDLSEANVTNVTFNKISNQNYNFVVTLYHDDDGEDGYADSWQVETLDGTILGTRILTHAHGTVEFTRSGDINILETVNTVVVRGHDQTHDFGGQVMILSLLNATKIFINQGPNPLDFSTFSFDDYSEYISVESTIDETASSTVTTVNDLSSPTVAVSGPVSESNNLDFNFFDGGLILLFSIPLVKLIVRQRNNIV